ncbi:MAG: bifunctional [glutamine synthetase] adenylyltransferase/[glutamine synthetase]-adenylyl-L-tyrosine phosphorylase [Microbacteriaceae bacterium]|nr:bifunctional [glutamine synthetase] adenylyltransferase/[glutamine synthetase]-adenylyl-L-tyrosine phosphorylase [Microbacteriaceae bacterium]
MAESFAGGTGAETTPLSLSVLARAGFIELSAARQNLAQLSDLTGVSQDFLLEIFAVAADADVALRGALSFAELPAGAVLAAAVPGGESAPVSGAQILQALQAAEWQRLALLFGASAGLMQFWVRQPQQFLPFLQYGARIRNGDQLRQEMCAAVQDAANADGLALPAERGWQALRVRYRQLLSEIMLADLEAQAVSGTPLGSGGGVAAEVSLATVTLPVIKPRPLPGGSELQATRAEPAKHIAPEAPEMAVRASNMLQKTSAALSNLAQSALEAALLVARATLASGMSVGLPVTRQQALETPLGIVAMGKCGAGELNVASDVDVMFVTADSAGEGDLRAATRIASETMRAIHAPAIEPALWEVDPNLRPEGKNGPLVRTVASYLSYYDRWAATWEFQALLKARAVAGDLVIAQQLIDDTRPLVWASSKREDFVGSVQRMRERVTEHIDPSNIDHQIKLGPGGLRDVEFTVQLLQLVHGTHDETLRVANTLEGIKSLVEGGYIARGDGDKLADAYRQLRTWEHRLQLRHLRRTALFPREADEVRFLARVSGFAGSDELLQVWHSTRRLVRQLHLKVFYAPLLSAVAELHSSEFALTSDAAAERLASIGFRNPQGALQHLRALTGGTKRRSQIQRNLLPVLLHWLGDGADPDAGLLAFRRISEANAEAPWYLRLLRDGSEVAERFTRVLSSSKYAANLLELMPESVAWLERDSKLVSLSYDDILAEMRRVASRRDVLEKAAKQVRGVHRREILRLALGRLVGVNSEEETAAGLDRVHSALLVVLLEQVQRFAPESADIEIALIAMGRFGGQEMGFASDLDLIAVYRAPEGRDGALADATKLLNRLRGLAADPVTGLALDFDLRPEGKNGALLRTLAGYRAYYERWSLTWEAQALLRARFVAGSESLGREFLALADEVRYPADFGAEQLREVRRMKARVETERLPRGADPKRHLKLGPGGVSDTEWLVQLWQLQHAARVPALRTPHTLQALQAAVDAGLCAAEDAACLTRSWQLASQLRSAEKLWSGASGAVLPRDRFDLEGIGRILGHAEGSTTILEEAWFAASRRARRVFEQHFFGVG